MILGVTGHRPNKLGGYEPLTQEQIRVFAQTRLLKLKPDFVLTGMALGWDQGIAQACVDFRVPFRAYIPFEGQESKWPYTARKLYHKLLAQAAEQKICCDGEYAAWKMIRRDQLLVQDCEHLLSLYNGTSGGTQRTWMYAVECGRDRTNCWNDWLIFVQELQGTSP
jgi:uncharacterized phage-like protein YoqJ